MINFSKEIEMAERAREDRRWIEASRILGGVVISAAMENQWLDVAKALGHKLVIYKLRFEGTNEAGWLVLMRSDAEAVVRISDHYRLPAEIKSVGLLRLGDYHLLTSNAPLALKNYKKAITLLPTTDDARFAEYLSSFTLAQVLAGFPKQFEIFGKALEILDEAKRYSPEVELRNEHRLIIRAGILLKAAQASRFTPRHRNKTKALLRQAKTEALHLTEQYRNNNRLDQIKSFAKSLKIEV